MNQQELDRLAADPRRRPTRAAGHQCEEHEDQLKLTDRKRELLLMLQQTGALKDALHTLLGEKKAIPDRGRCPARAHSEHRPPAVSHGREAAG